MEEDFVRAEGQGSVGGEVHRDAEPERVGALYWRPLPDGYEVVVYPMSFGKARLCYGQQGEDGYLDAFCYERPLRAIEAASVWTGEGDPLDGWHRNPITGRRRENGDPAKEYHRW
jgi:hypothetical protein